MKRILQIVDTYDWAIGTLSKAIVKYNPHFDWQCIAVHPKDLEQGKVDLTPIIEEIKKADIIDAQYWRTIAQLFDKIPELKDKPVYLTHHNEKNLLSYEWTNNVIHIVKTRYSEKILREKYPNAKIFYIANSFDHETFRYNAEFPPKEKTVGFVGRVVPWKGLKDVAKACYELKYPLMIMGKMDKPSYWEEIPAEHRENIDMSFFNCDDKDRVDFYKHITCYVGNSGSGREVGTLGFIEALACGVPVVTTPSGLAADIGDHEENMLLVDYDDYDGLKEAISKLMESPSLQQKFRKNGWDTIRGYNDERMAYEYRKAYNTMLHKPNLVSVVIPTHPERLSETKVILDALKESTYKNIEAVVVFDHLYPSGEKPLARSEYPFPVKFIANGIEKGYNLGMNRNLGVIEADGEFIMFNDSRMKPDEDAISCFMALFETKTRDHKIWLFGEKGGEKTTFVENFSMIRRRHFIEGGMCNERINAYGGMSQELRERFGRQGFEFGYVPAAKAEQISKSSLTPVKRDGLIRMKNLLYKIGF